MHKSCLTCGSTFDIPKHREETAKYCSRTCRRHSKETREKMSLSTMGERNPMKRIEVSSKFRGDKNPAWSGGRTTHSKGYIYTYDPNHFETGTHKYILEHRKVMADFLGRSLLSQEDVHHKNGNKKDNRVENLVVLSKREHTTLHRLG